MAGCTCPGDVAKAFGAGADFVMLGAQEKRGVASGKVRLGDTLSPPLAGGMFAGHNESGGDVVVKPDGSRYKAFYGMSSSVVRPCGAPRCSLPSPPLTVSPPLPLLSQAMGKYSGGTAEYRSSEGKAVEVPYRGPVEGTLLSILGGLRSACTYVGERRAWRQGAAPACAQSSPHAKRPVRRSLHPPLCWYRRSEAQGAVQAHDVHPRPRAAEREYAGVRGQAEPRLRAPGRQRRRDAWRRAAC